MRVVEVLVVWWLAANPSPEIIGAILFACVLCAVAGYLTGKRRYQCRYQHRYVLDERQLDVLRGVERGLGEMARGLGAALVKIGARA